MSQRRNVWFRCFPPAESALAGTDSGVRTGLFPARAAPPPTGSPWPSHSPRPWTWRPCSARDGSTGCVRRGRNRDRPLDDAELVRRIRGLGGTDALVLDDPELLGLAGPARAARRLPGPHLLRGHLRPAAVLSRGRPGRPGRRRPRPEATLEEVRTRGRVGLGRRPPSGVRGQSLLPQRPCGGRHRPGPWTAAG